MNADPPDIPETRLGRWFGSDRPSVLRILLTGGLWMSLPLAVLGAFVPFLPADGLHGPPIQWALGLIGLCVTAGIALMAMLGGGRRGSGHTLSFGALTVLLLLPVGIAALVWLVAVKALPWAYTRAYGAPARIETTVRTEFVRSSKRCDHRIVGGALAMSGVGHLCIDAALYRRAPERRIVVTLQGRRSRLGFAVMEVKYLRESEMR